MTGNKKHRAKLEIDANKAVVYLCGSVFIAVTLWLGTSVNEMTHKLERLSTAFEFQAELIQGFRDDQKQLREQLEAVKQEQARRSDAVGRISELAAGLNRLEVRVSALETPHAD